MTTATKELQQRINDIVEMFVGGSTDTFAKALETMKKYCIGGMEVELFNNYMAELKVRAVCAKPLPRRHFFLFVVVG